MAEVIMRNGVVPAEETFARVREAVAPKHTIVLQDLLAYRTEPDSAYALDARLGSVPSPWLLDRGQRGGRRRRRPPSVFGPWYLLAHPNFRTSSLCADDRTAIARQTLKAFS